MRRSIHPPRRTLAGCLALVALTAGATACGDDDDDEDPAAAAVATTQADAAAPTEAAAATTAEAVSPTTEAAAPTTEAAAPTIEASGPTTGSGSVPAELAGYCAAAEELNSQDELPTTEQIEAYAALAPPDIAEPMDVVMGLLAENDGDFTIVFGDPDGQAALEEITAFEAETCGLAPPDEGPPQDPSVTVLDPNATRVDVEASEYHFEAEFPTSAGRYSFVMTNGGEEMHIMILARLEEGAALEDALASEGEEGIAEEFESELAQPGAEAVVTADLTPGEWVLLCPIPGPNGAPHFTEGMIHEFTIS